MEPAEGSSAAPAPSREPDRRKLAVIAAAVAVVAAGAVFAIASRSDDVAQPPPTGLTAINAGADTGLSTASAAPDDSAAVAPSTSSDASSTSAAAITAGELSRELLEPGVFDCVETGLWQPYAELQLVIEVGEPAADSVCPDAVLRLPEGYCSADPCREVPADWEIRLEDGVPAAELLLVVAPDSPDTGRFYCYRNLGVDQARFYELATPIDEACPPPPPDSIDIPYVPPETSDIPFVPPPPSLDVPPG